MLGDNDVRIVMADRNIGDTLEKLKNRNILVIAANCTKVFLLAKEVFSFERCPENIDMSLEELEDVNNSLITLIIALAAKKEFYERNGREKLPENERVIK